MNELISIVLPVHNQGDHIGVVLDEFVEAFQKVQYRYEILLIVNACRDNSHEVCIGLSEKYPSVTVLDTEKGGWGYAVTLGLGMAKGGILCYTNSARTSGADLLLLVLYAIANPGSVVKAHRRYRETIKRRVGSLLYNLECRILFDLPTWDINSTPKAFSRRVYESIELTNHGDLIDLEFFLECKRIDVQVLEVPIYSELRHGGRSTTGMKTAIGLYWGAIELYRSRKNKN